MLLPNATINANAYGVFVHTGLELIQEFNDSVSHCIVIYAILKTLTQDINTPLYHPEHPFNRYADRDDTMDTICNRIQQDVRDRLANESAFTRSLVRGFCSPRGVYRGDLEEFVGKYFEFVDACV